MNPPILQQQMAAIRTLQSTVSGTVATNGSTSMEKVIGNLKEQFENDNDGNVTVSYDATGSGAGIEAVVNGTADIGLSSRALKEEETSSGLKGTTIAGRHRRYRQCRQPGGGPDGGPDRQDFHRGDHQLE